MADLDAFPIKADNLSPRAMNPQCALRKEVGKPLA
jgi:hypothetical protein